MKILNKKDGKIDNVIFRMDFVIKQDSIGQNYVCNEGLLGPDNGYYLDPYRGSCPIGDNFRYATCVTKSNRGLIIKDLSIVPVEKFKQSIFPTHLYKYDSETEKCVLTEEAQTLDNPSFNLEGTVAQIGEQIKSLFKKRFLPDVCPLFHASRPTEGSIENAIYCRAYAALALPFSPDPESPYRKWNVDLLLAPLGFKKMREAFMEYCARYPDDPNYEEYSRIAKYLPVPSIHINGPLGDYLLKYGATIQNAEDRFFFQVCFRTLFPEMKDYPFKGVEEDSMVDEAAYEAYRKEIDDMLGADW